MNQLWQRFLLASSLIVGLFIGVAATVFGYSNLTTVDVHWSIFHIDGIPLWTVAVVPLALFVIAGTLYHWVDGLHHFTEHMRHRRRVHELEAEVASLRAHLDQVLEMPERSTSSSTSRPAIRKPSTVSLPAADERVADDAPAEVEAVVVAAAAPKVEPVAVAAAASKVEPVAVVAAAPEPEAPAVTAVDGNPHGDDQSPKRSRSARRRRLSLEAAGDDPQPTNRSAHLPEREP